MDRIKLKLCKYIFKAKSLNSYLYIFYTTNPFSKQIT